ncbi:carbohydrate kinase family protein [Streptomyces sp. SID8358]|uniref:PfkB family carbohydrate kinase n=1 Tax=Streptomyces sp. SID8358 TaxID=2690342 RepID=UPI000DABE086|nr:carbohydrate kinase family protein [Streptomyces sp. SID8358]
MDMAITGSLASDHLMVFPGRFADQLLPGSLERVSLSFLADHLEVRRGGVGANIAFGLGLLGLRPVLVGSAGLDFAPYDAWLRAAGVDTAWVRVSETLHTARFVCTTDADQNQIATFYAGAMAEARHIDLRRVAREAALGLVLVGADDPQAMLRHTAAAHGLGVPVAADPSQQLARLEKDEVRLLVDGAHLLFTNEYEADLLRERTGWTERQVLERVGTWITTRGADGVLLSGAGRTPVGVPAAPTDHVVDPTGAGDAFRAGFLAGVARGRSQVRAAQLGCVVATTVLESVGTQEYKIVAADVAGRAARAYGSEVAGELESILAATG